MRKSQEQNALVLSLKKYHQMDDSDIKNMSESDIVMPIKKEELFCALSVKSEILRCFLSDERLIFRKLSDATEILQRTRNKLEILVIKDAQVYTKIIYRIDEQFNDWVQERIRHPTELDAIYWEVIDFRDMTSNIKNMDIQPDPIPPRFRTFNAIDTKTTKGSINKDHTNQASKKICQKK